MNQTSHFKSCPGCNSLNSPQAGFCQSCGRQFSGSAPPVNTHQLASQPSRGIPVMVAIIVASLCIGGWFGNILNGQVIKGLAILLATIVLGVITGGLALIVIYPTSIIDAVMGTHKLGEGKILGTWEFF